MDTTFFRAVRTLPMRTKLLTAMTLARTGLLRRDRNG